MNTTKNIIDDIGIFFETIVIVLLMWIVGSELHG